MSRSAIWGEGDVTVGNWGKGDVNGWRLGRGDVHGRQLGRGGCHGPRLGGCIATHENRHDLEPGLRRWAFKSEEAALWVEAEAMVFQ